MGLSEPRGARHPAVQRGRAGEPRLEEYRHAEMSRGATALGTVAGPGGRLERGLSA